MNARLAEGHNIVLTDATWPLYECLRRELDSHQQIVFDGSRIEVIAPPITFAHEEDRVLLCMLLDRYCFTHKLPVTACGGPTLAAEHLGKACEPDASYYILAEPPPPEADELDLQIHKPPDLVLEVDLTSHAVSKEPVYAAMGVAELWRWENSDLDVRRLAEGKYASVEQSVLLPDLPVRDLAEMVRLGRRKPQHEVLSRWSSQLRA